jgi:endonuclease/exonuclease/phosphatase family metal-dependent hydrolase
MLIARTLIFFALSVVLAACSKPCPPGGVAEAPAARPLEAEGVGAREQPLVARDDATSTAAAELEALAFTSRERCDALVSSGRLLPRREGVVRFGSWNIRFFPDGGPNGPHKPTDVEWLACAIAFMQVDVLAVQEFLAPAGDSAARIQSRHRALLERLETLTGHTWSIVLDECELNRRDRQHVGFVYNRSRVELARARHVSRMNPDGGCKSLRPGLAVDVRAKGGLDLHVVSFHAKAYGDERSRARREHVYSSMGAIVSEIRGRDDETDLLILGDFNTVGCDDCPTRETPHEEAQALGRAAEKAGLTHVQKNLPCSHYWDRAGSFGALDHVLADSAMRELESHVHVSGFCAASACAYHGGASHTALSDHCPVLVDLVDEDRDP